MFDEMLGSFGGILMDLEDTNPLGIFEGMNHWGWSEASGLVWYRWDLVVHWWDINEMIMG